ncbi:MAG: hypothetical protein K1060chlam1_00698 [Candidatus Anoxychlamydiales bacterium]|nr:hypothetical protein [Candidatus Anoxychlamydiales bacterium]
MVTTWRLPSEIISLSHAKTWGVAIREWELDYIEKLDPGEESETCLCGHAPIRELCHIINTQTSARTIVGNHCILRFDRDDPGHEVLGVAAKIFQACNRILKDPLVSANEELIDYALKKSVFTEANAEFYKDVRLKRNLTSAQADYKENLNNQLLYSIILSAKAAFLKLKENSNRTAGPKLIEYAFTKGILNEKAKAFYLQIWNRSNASLTQSQRNYKYSLNRRIIQRIRVEDFAIDRREDSFDALPPKEPSAHESSSSAFQPYSQLPPVEKSSSSTSFSPFTQPSSLSSASSSSGSGFRNDELFASLISVRASTNPSSTSFCDSILHATPSPFLLEPHLSAFSHSPTLENSSAKKRKREESIF